MKKVNFETARQILEGKEIKDPESYIKFWSLDDNVEVNVTNTIGLKTEVRVLTLRDKSTGETFIREFIIKRHPVARTLAMIAVIVAVHAVFVSYIVKENSKNL
jgi:hypothetical protein